MSNKPKFAALIKGETPVLVDFYADWCGPCKTMSPILSQLSSQLHGRLKVIKINVDKNQAVAGQYQVRSIPTFILFRQGKAIWRQTGASSLNELQRQLEPHLV